MSEEQTSEDQNLWQSFDYSGLPTPVQSVCAPYRHLANKLMSLPESPHRTAALRHLCRAKESAVLCLDFKGNE